MSDLPYVAYSHGNNNRIELGNADNSGEAGEIILFDEGNNTQAIITIDDGLLRVDGETIEYFLRQLVTQNTGRGPLDGEVIAYRASTGNLIWSTGGSGSGVGSGTMFASRYFAGRFFTSRYWG